MRTTGFMHTTWHHCSVDSPTSPGPVHVGSTKRTFNKCVENPFSVPKLSAHSMVYESLKYLTDSPCLLSISNWAPASAGCLWSSRGLMCPASIWLCTTVCFLRSRHVDRTTLRGGRSLGGAGGALRGLLSSAESVRFISGAAAGKH